MGQLRADSVGLFWQEYPTENTRKGILVPRVMPPIPDTGWKPPREFPRLDSAKVLCIDTETKDPGLLDHGPGWGRNSGHIVGLAVGTDDGHKWYFPMRHEVGTEDNLDPATVLSWARNTFSNPVQPKIFTNAIYDLGWLAEEGVKVAGAIIDIQVAEPLIDELARSYSLNSLGLKYLGEGKRDETLYAWLALAYGGKAERAQAGNIYRAPPCLVGPYAEGDVDLPLLIWEKQKQELAAQDLMGIFELESSLIRILLAMRQRGVRVDLTVAQSLDDELSQRIQLLQDSELRGVNVNATTSLMEYAKHLGLKTVPRTAASDRFPDGQASFAGKWVDRNMPAVAELRELYKMRDTFIRSYIFEHQVDGRIHAMFNQLRGDEYGAVSGRLSSSNPNLQNVPTRTAHGKRIRQIYVPDEGENWVRLDWSQIEFRMLCHYGRGRGVKEVQQAYRDDPTTDFHTWVQELVWPGQPDMRDPSKSINFGLVYGMGQKTLAENLSMSRSLAAPIFRRYHQRLPFVKTTYNAVAAKAESSGEIRTLLGRLRRFPYGQNTHKALNALLQGSAADLMKKAMRDIWESGVCNVLGAPLLTEHDELDWSVPRTLAGQEAIAEVKAIMENCVPLRVPVIAARDAGVNWAECKK
jgi:DNA polymerase I-like protein with 3'-5' exonuclease and polymerase domains